MKPKLIKLQGEVDRSTKQLDLKTNKTKQFSVLNGMKSWSIIRQIRKLNMIWKQCYKNNK